MLEGNHQLGLRAVQHIARRRLVFAALQERGRIQSAFGLGQDGKNRADGNIDIDVGRTVQRVEQHQIAAVFMAGDEAVFFLAGQPRHLRVLPQRVYQQIIGQHVEFFLFFALHVAAARRTEHARKRAQPHQPADAQVFG